jgi:hypothetical protein
VVAAWLLRRVGFRREIDRVWDVLALVGLGALVSTAISASVGVGSLWLSGILPDTQVRVGWAIWWFGDAAGMLTVAPLLLLASTVRHWRRPEPGRVLEAAALAATLVLIVQAGLTERVARPFLVFPALVWAAVRFRQAGAAVASLLVSAVVVWLTLHDRGPFVEPSLTQSLLLTQAATGAVMATSLALAAQTVQRELAARTLGRREHQLAEAHAQAELSRRLQNGLLPVLSLHDPALLLRTRYQPGQRRALLGADFYDALELPDGTVATLIGDVAGHGPDEAAVGVALRAAWRGLVLSGHGPRGLLDGLDKVLVSNRPSEEMFTTVCCTWISPDRTRVTVAPAGHPRRCWWMAGGSGPRSCPAARPSASSTTATSGRPAPLRSGTGGRCCATPTGWSKGCGRRAPWSGSGSTGWWRPSPGCSPPAAAWTRCSTACWPPSATPMAGSCPTTSPSSAAPGPGDPHQHPLVVEVAASVTPWRTDVRLTSPARQGRFASRGQPQVRAAHRLTG